VSVRSSNYLKTPNKGIYKREIGYHPIALKKDNPFGLSRAGDGTRTHDLLLGKETFYQLNHARMLVSQANEILLESGFAVNPFLQSHYKLALMASTLSA
jgi:hypothetical protein